VKLKDVAQEYADKQRAQLIAIGRQMPVAQCDKTLAQIEAEVLIEIRASRIERESQQAAEQAYAQAVHRGIEKAVVPIQTKVKTNRTKQRVSWQTELPYVASVFNLANQTGAKGLWRELKAKAGNEDSPFIVGTGTDRDKLVVKKTYATLAEHTLENNMGMVRNEAAKLNKA
jgi:hypothetical protein